MYKHLLLFIGVIFVVISCKENPMTDNNEQSLDYPEVFRDSAVVDDYHGTEIADPYRWLEDDNSTETKEWVTAQNEVTQDYLARIPFRSKVRDRLKELLDYERYGSPFKEAGNYYYFKNDGLQNQSVLYQLNDDGEDDVIINPNEFSEDGTSSLAGLSFSKDGRYIAYLVSEGGSDWRTAKVLDLSTKTLLSDELEWIKFSGITWVGGGFYYSRYPVSNEGDELSGLNEYHSLYYHKLGEDQSADELIYKNPDHPKRNVGAGVTDDESILVVVESESTKGNSVKIKDLKSNGSMQSVFDGFDADYNLIDRYGDQLYFLTDANAPKKRLISVDINNLSNIQDVIPESADVIQSLSIAGGKIFAEYIHNASSQVKVFDLDGNHLSDLELPGIGNVSGISGKKEETEAFFSFSSYTFPTSIYSLNTEDLSYQLFKAPEIDMDLSNYVTEQIWFKSYDGADVPMFVTHKKGLKKDGSNPTMLYGYGGFNISLLPGFSTTMLPILENGGIYAVVNLRGGGEFGSEWHKSGTKERKQNVFDDFQSAAEHLIDQGYTSSEKLAIRGGSNGGLLVGACMTQRPDLYAVAFPAVGVLDMLRYHEFTIGWAWAEDYGRSDDPEAFKYLIEYSPLHNLTEQEYPATMITTADHDDRVVPAHSFKFASELQHNHQGSNPVVIRVETSAGHGAGKPTDKVIDEMADLLSFMYYNMDEEMSFKVKG
jgi:prolyl oligopeptidase